MKNRDFIEQNIGQKVYLTAAGDLGMTREYRPFINNQSRYLTIVKLTKSGMALLKGDDDKYYSIPPRNVRLIGTYYNTKNTQIIDEITRIGSIMWKIQRIVNEWKDGLDDLTANDEKSLYHYKTKLNQIVNTLSIEDTMEKRIE